MVGILSRDLVATISDHLMNARVLYIVYLLTDTMCAVGIVGSNTCVKLCWEVAAQQRLMKLGEPGARFYFPWT
jgi:hypothetical protein